MKKEKSTIHDIARKLNITASTVSRALNDHPRISVETKKAVLKAAQKLNYQPNLIAAALRNGKSNIIGIIVPTADRSFFSSVIRGIEEIANRGKYNVMICQTYDNYEKEVASVEALLNSRVDGIIASHGKETINFDHFRHQIDGLSSPVSDYAGRHQRALFDRAQGKPTFLWARTDAAVARLKREAAALGANGVVLMGVGSSGSPVGMSVGAGTFGSHVGGGVGIGIPTTQKRAAGVAIWVPNPAPPARLPTQVITPQR